MAITDNDLIALSSLSEVDRRRVRDMPRGIGPAALLRLERLLLVKREGARISDCYTRTAAGTGVLRNNAGRLEQLKLSGKLDIVQLAEIATITSAVSHA
ncbi:hypothetical protein [Azospirillum sp. A29]|uniref:hypothetical protein n=1 Tax=unclassified Azospirillum TaxID=2630922 RepID=UPI00367087E9